MREIILNLVNKNTKRVLGSARKKELKKTKFVGELCKLIVPVDSEDLSEKKKRMKVQSILMSCLHNNTSYSDNDAFNEEDFIYKIEKNFQLNS